MTDAGQLIDLLHARRGIICAVGAGGKKSTLYNLIARHPGRAALTSTVNIRHFPAELRLSQLIMAEAQLLTAAKDATVMHVAELKLAFAAPSVKPERYAGLSPQLITDLHNACRLDATFVKADGARMRWIKAPKADEPVLPDGCTTVIPLVSAHAIGRILSPEIAHRPELIANVTGLEQGATIEPEHVARLLVNDAGMLKATAGRMVVPVINMVDNTERQKQARAVAAIALAATDRFDYVILATMRNTEQPVVAVIAR